MNVHVALSDSFAHIGPDCPVWWGVPLDDERNDRYTILK